MMNSVHDIFLPNGQLRNLKFAMDASKMGSIAVGVSTSNCVVLVAEKRIAMPLIMPKKIEKIFRVDEHIGCVMSGAIADGRPLIHLSRVHCQEHWFDYNESIPIESCTEHMSTLVMPPLGLEGNFTPSNRPIGVAFLFGGFDGEDPQLWHLNPSGNYNRHLCKSIGVGRELAVKFLEENYKPQLEYLDVIKLCLIAIHGVMNVPLTGTNVEVMYMTKAKKECTKVSEVELQTIIDGMN